MMDLERPEGGDKNGQASLVPLRGGRMGKASIARLAAVMLQAFGSLMSKLLHERNEMPF